MTGQCQAVAIFATAPETPEAVEVDLELGADCVKVLCESEHRYEFTRHRVHVEGVTYTWVGASLGVFEDPQRRLGG